MAIDPKLRIDPAWRIHYAKEGRHDMQSARKARFLYPGCVLIAAVLLLVCTKSSPLYPLNDWVDVNIYFTIGKGLMHGRIPYLDLYDQKGPMVYLLYGIASLLSERSFLGVYVLEALSFGAFLWISARCIALFTDRIHLGILPLLGTLILTSLSFSHGGSLEEFCLPVLAYALLCALRYYQRDYPLRKAPLSMVFFNGLLAGVLLFSKFTLLSLYFAWMAVLFFSQCLNRHALHGLKCCAVFLCGMLLVGVPWVIFFAVNDALPEFYYYYFYTNIFGYSTLQPPVLLNMLYAIVRSTLVALVRNASYGVLIGLGLLWFTFSKASKLPAIGRVALWAMALLLPFGLYMGGQSYRYYGLTLAAFAPLGCVPVIRLYDAQFAPKLCKLRIQKYAPAILTLFCAGASLCISSNVYLLGTPKEDTPQGQFASVIAARQTTEPPKLLCRAFPDSGFYLAANVLPFNRFFSSNNVMLPENAAQQVALIADGVPEFVVTRNRAEAPSTQYTLVDTASMVYEDDLWIYRLYQRNAAAASDPPPAA